MDAFNWLHLSDLHWGCPSQKGSWPEIRRRFFESLHILHAKCGPWHAVFFTGDLVQKGQDFQQMEEQTLLPLWGEFRKLGSTPVLLAVPGNHDLERPSTEPPSPEVRVLMKPGQLREIAEEFWEDAKSPYRKVIDEAFAQYSTWWSKRPFCDRQQIDEGLLPGDFSTTFTTDAGRHVGVVGLNTTFLQLAEGDYRYRTARIAYLARSQPNVTQPWRGRIIFRQGCDASGRPFIECEDNGVGMGRQELDECFARAGRRFVDLPEFIEEQSDWLACDPPIRLYPNAQFGIGVFSYLLLADELLIETCRFRRDGSLGQPMVARVSGSGGLFRVSEVVNANQGGAGTRVRLYLNRTNWKDQPISCAAKLSEILWAAQFETEVHEGGDILHWSPEELRHPRLKPQEYVNAGGQDVWWSSHDGQILVDGLAIGTSQYDFCVANLRGPRRPHLMLNRSAIMPHEGPMPEWDKSFVDENLLQGVDRLRTWPDLTVAWLWRVARGNWKLAEKLLDVLCLGDCDIRIGRDQRGDRTVSLRKLGCFDGDEVLLDVLMNVDVSHTPICAFGILPEWLLPWRVALWESEGIPVPQQVWRALPKPAQGISSPRLVPGDSMVLSSSLGGRDWLAGKVPMSHLIRAAAKMQEPITAIMTRLERFAPFGVSLPDVLGLDLDRFSARADDIIALSKNSHEGGVCLDDRASATHIIRVAAKLATPLDSVIARFQEYERLGIKLPPSIRNGSDISGIAVRREYLAMLAGDLNEGGISLDDRIPPVHLVHIAGKTKRTVAEVLMDLAPFATMGLRLPEVTDPTQLCFVPTDDDLLALSERLDRQAPISDDRISSAHIVRIAFKLNRPVATVVTDLTRFAPLGVSMPEVELSRVGNLTVTAEDARAMSQNRGTWGLSIGDRVPGVHIVLLSCELQEPLVNVFRLLSRFGCLGLQLPDVDLHKADSIRKMGLEDLTALSQNCDGDWPWLDGVVTQEHVRRAATELYDSPDEIVERLRAFECLGLTVPSGDCETWDQ